MAILATTTAATREAIPSGNYVARCYRMIQIGTVNEVINGENKLLQKVRIGWEFPNDLKVFHEDKGPQPIVYDEEYTLSMGEKASLRKMLASWRGKDFTPDQAKSFDITALLGVTAMVNLIHVTSKSSGKVYSKIGSVSAVPKGIEVPAQINPTFVLSYDNFDFEKFNSLPDFIKDKMKSSIEYTALVQPNSQAMSSGHPDGLPAPVRDAHGNTSTSTSTILSGPASDLDSDVPF